MSRPCALLLLLTILFTVTTVTAALAVPTKLSQQGRLLDGDGDPLIGTHALIFSIYDAATGGNEVWREERSVDFEEGYYAVVLGELVPVDDLLFSAGAVWLELTVDGSVLSPRQEIVSVPWALRATSAEHLDGGVVEAAEISVGGVPVIDSTGTWVGPTPSVDWTELTGVPGDIADGDQDTDTDTLAGLACAQGEVPKWDAASGLWICGTDVDTVDPNTDTLADLGLSCLDGQIARYSSSSGLWLCDAETVTTSLPWSAITGVPGDIADGDADTDSLADLGQLCANGDRPAWDSSQSQWTCASEQVNLDRLDTNGAAAGQVLTFDGANVGWEEGSSVSNPPCSLNQTIGDQASFDCNGEQVVVQTLRTISSIGSPNGCGIKPDGSITCWRSPPYAPGIPVGVFTDVVALNGKGCALNSGGLVECWYNPAYSSSYYPEPSGTFAAIAGDNEDFCGIRTNGSIDCWDRNVNGSLIDFSVTAGRQFTQVSAGGNSFCGVEASGSVICWGYESFTELSPPAESFVQIAGGAYNWCGIKTDGTIACWGVNMQLWDIPTPSGSFVEIATSNGSYCALDSSGTPSCWGGCDGLLCVPPSSEYSFAELAGGQTSNSSFCGVESTLSTVICWGGYGHGVAM